MKNITDFGMLLEEDTLVFEGAKHTLGGTLTARMEEVKGNYVKLKMFPGN